MRPLKLTINAFGSYANTQEIDFTKLGATGIYLITGETGSGKTTQLPQYLYEAVNFIVFYGKSFSENLRVFGIDKKTLCTVKI